MIAYFLLVMLGRAFSSMPGLAAGIARDVRDGTIKKYLTQPVDMLAYLFWARVAHKVVYYLVAAGPFALVFYLCRGYFSHAPDLTTVAAFVLSVLDPPPVRQNPIPVEKACGTPFKRPLMPPFAVAPSAGIVSINPVAELHVGAELAL